MSLSKTSDLNPSGDTIRVEGKGFKTSGPGIYVGIAQNDQMDVTNADSFGPDTKFVSTSRGNLKSDGSFSVDLPVSAKFGTADCMQNACSVYTIAAHGSSDRSQDTATDLSVGGSAKEREEAVKAGASKTGESKASGSSKASGKASAKSNASGNGLDEVDVQTQQAATNSPLQTAAVAGTGAILGALIFGAGILVGRRQKSVD